MPFNGSGVFVYTATTVTPAVTDTTIDASEFNTFTADVATALSLCVTNDGQTSAPTINDPTLTSPIIDEILDSNSNELIDFVTTGSAVNNVRITNAATGNAAKIDVSETNTDLELAGNGTGGVYGTVMTHASSPFATTSGSSVSATGIPSWVKKITLTLNGVSTDGTGLIYFRIGDAGGLHTTNYDTTHTLLANGVSPAVSATAGSFIVRGSGAAADEITGTYTLVLSDATNHDWVFSGLSDISGQSMGISAGHTTLDTALTQLALITANTFDAGEFSVHYEG